MDQSQIIIQSLLLVLEQTFMDKNYRVLLSVLCTRIRTSSAEPRTPYPLQANQNLSPYLPVPQSNCADAPCQPAANMPVASSLVPFLIADNLFVSRFPAPEVFSGSSELSVCCTANYNHTVHHVPQYQPVRQPPLYLNHQPSMTYSMPLHYMNIHSPSIIPCIMCHNTSLLGNHHTT